MDSIEENEGSSSDVDDQASDQTIAPEEDASLMRSSSNDRSLSGALGSPKWKEDIQMKGTTNPLYTAVHERRGSVRPQPSHTVLYEVKGSDTLTGLAARFNTTPSELVNLNRLSSRTIFPGQIIFVPETGEPSTFLEPEKAIDPVNGQESPKPGHAERVRLLINKHLHIAEDAPRSPSQIAEDLNKESLYKFLKVKAKHITDGEGVVSGVLLVTPNHVMFDPNVSDVLVIEHGAEKYGVVAPMHMVVRAALYPDIMRMRIKDVAQPSPCEKKLQLYRSKNLTMKKSRSHNEALVAAASDNSLQNETKAAENVNHPPLLTRISECSLEYNVKSEDVSTENKEIEDVPEEPSPPPSQEIESESVVVSTTDLDILIPEVSVVVTLPCIDRQSSCEDENIAESPPEVEPSKKKGGFEKTKQKLQKGLRRLSISDGLFPSNLNQRRMSLPTASSFSELRLKSPTVPSFGKKNKNKEPKVKVETPVHSYMNMVDDKPELFASIEKLIPRPAKSFDDNPLYLCLRMGKPLKESLQTRFTPVMDFGRKMKTEYWFSIPREKVDSLYFFFLRWAPEKYGDVDDIDLEELGFAAIDEEEDDDDIVAGPPATFVPSQRRATWAFPWRRRKSEDATEIGKDPSSLSWEFVHPEDAKESSLTESELSLPELTSPSSILSEEHIRKLNEHLPPRAVAYAWELIYSTAVNGFSLKTLYREMANYDSPVLLIIENTSGSVFGAMLSCPLRISDHFYGTGESFVFTFYPEFKYFPWSGDNNYFIKGNTGSFAIGASDGQFGLWFDDDLYHGCSKECETFRNDCLSDQEDFVVQALEAWGFV